MILVDNLTKRQSSLWNVGSQFDRCNLLPLHCLLQNQTSMQFWHWISFCGIFPHVKHPELVQTKYSMLAYGFAATNCSPTSMSSFATMCFPNVLLNTIESFSDKHRNEALALELTGCSSYDTLHFSDTLLLIPCTWNWIWTIKMYLLIII